eukprot:TRINITY_DN4462_c0_g1_i4.p1 TRINITY_DN4462_c0_g1~~TRINITY_DN4462_c0_g1_i4.p1  ORF type:complete len:277 (+),score=23.93 TRINITY_DN4462_c0_g1_i4:141-971(+)
MTDDHEDSVVDVLGVEENVSADWAVENHERTTTRLKQLAHESSGDLDALGVEIVRVMTGEDLAIASPSKSKTTEKQSLSKKKSGTERKEWWAGKSKWGQRRQDLHATTAKAVDDERERDRKWQGKLSYQTAMVSGHHSRFFLEQFIHGFLSLSLCEHPFVRSLLKGETKVILLVPLTMEPETMDELREISQNALTSSKCDYGQQMVDFFRPYLIPRTDEFEKWWNGLLTHTRVASPNSPRHDLFAGTESPRRAKFLEIGRAVQQECRDRSRMPSSA